MIIVDPKMTVLLCVLVMGLAIRNSYGNQNPTDTGQSTYMKHDEMNTNYSEYNLETTQNNICKVTVRVNFTSTVKYRVDKFEGCRRRWGRRCGGKKRWTTSVGYKNITRTLDRIENVCCDGFKNESGVCVPELNLAEPNVTSQEVTEREAINTATKSVIITLPFVAIAVVLSVAVLIYNRTRAKKTSKDTERHAFDNQIYNSVPDENTYASIDGAAPTYEQLNRELVAKPNVYDEVHLYQNGSQR